MYAMRHVIVSSAMDSSTLNSSAMYSSAMDSSAMGVGSLASQPYFSSCACAGERGRGKGRKNTSGKMCRVFVPKRNVILLRCFPKSHGIHSGARRYRAGIPRKHDRVAIIYYG